MQVEFTVDASDFASLDAARPERRLDRGELTGLARAVEAAGIDRLLLRDRGGKQDVAALASYILHATSTLGVAVEHRAGTLEPEIAARQIATLDQLSGGRLGVHVTAPAGEGLSHEESHARLDEFLVLVKRLWSNDEPIDHEGRFHRLKGACCGTRPFGAEFVPFALSGVSGTAVKVAARHAERFLLPAASVEETRRTVERVRAAASSFGRARSVRFALPVRPGAARAGSTDIEATPVAGSPEKVALKLLDYCEVGVTDFVVSGLATPGEVAAFGAAVAPLVRRTLAHRDGLAVEQMRSGAGNVVFARWSRHQA